MLEIKVAFKRRSLIASRSLK